jgi:hypothetical protein
VLNIPVTQQLIDATSQLSIDSSTGYGNIMILYTVNQLTQSTSNNVISTVITGTDHLYATIELEPDIVMQTAVLT